MKLIVENMTCQHCATNITKLIQALDANAQIQIELKKQQVSIQSDKLTAQQVVECLTAEEYLAVEISED